MSDVPFTHDVFRNHSSKGKALVRKVAERLWMNGQRVWSVAPKRPREGGFDEWESPSPAGDGSRRPGGGHGAEARAAKIEEWQEDSRVLACPAVASARRRMLSMSAHAFGTDWAQSRLTVSQQSTLNHQPPGAQRNKERHLIPLRLDDAPIKGSLAQFLYINWLSEHREHECPALRGALRKASAEISLRN